MIDLYGYYPSGNSYKIELALHQLDIPFAFHHLDIVNGATRTPAFLKMNPNGKIPVAEVAPGKYLAESHAILWYFAHDSFLVPRDPWLQASMWQWLCFEQYQLEPKIGVLRYHLHVLGKTARELAPLTDRLLLEGHHALSVLDEHLTGKTFAVGETYSLADIGLYGYTHVAAEGGFEMERYPAIGAWLARVREQPRHRPMQTGP